jgi:hypothetical protein
MTGKQVAIKKMLHLFHIQTLTKRTYRELKPLMYLNHPDAQVCIKSFSHILPTFYVFLML